MPDGAYTVRLHFVEHDSNMSVGVAVLISRVGGSTVLGNFDVRAAAGAANRAVTSHVQRCASQQWCARYQACST